MSTLKIDDKWSVEYDPVNNDRPVSLLRHGEAHPDGVGDWKNPERAMFYALLGARQTKQSPDPVALANDDAFTAAFLNALADRIHADNVEAGWWSHLGTGRSILHTRNVPEMLMLIVSEVSEAMEAHRKGLMDDKLPNRPGLQSELADALIRIFDLAGSRAAIERESAFSEIVKNPIGDILIEKRVFNRTRADHQIENRRKDGGKKI